MSPAALAAYLGGATAGAVAAAGLAAAAARLATGRWPRAAAAGLALSATFVILLALHPFPDPAAVDCKAPRLVPFNFADVYLRLWRVGTPLADWLTSPAALSPAMNLVLFAPVGVCLVRLGCGRGAIAAAALGLTGLIEVTQLTGLWGIYPCPYRHFDVDDLILNTAGILAGAALTGIGGRCGPASRA